MPVASIPVIDSFEIKRKIDYNKIDHTKQVIHDYTPYCGRVDKIFKQLDQLGANKSASVLQTINKGYLEEKIINPTFNPDQIFLRTIENVIKKVRGSSNFVQIPQDELDLAVGVLVVNAFIRCKIFDNPVKYSYVTA